MLAVGRLLRLSLAPSVLADVAAGIVFANQGRWPSGIAPFCLMASSACVYHGAMALNDWHDREHDARTRASRPIPSGAVSARTALVLGAALLIIGPLIALRHSEQAALWSLALALLALAYDLGTRGTFLGPLMLALCRAGNLGLGLLFAGGTFAAAIPIGAAIVPMLTYAWFVYRVSKLGRMEDGEDRIALRGRPQALVLSAALVLVLVALLPPPAEGAYFSFGRFAAIAIAWPAAFTLARPVVSSPAWGRAEIERAMGACLRRFLIFSAALAALSWSPPAYDAPIVALLILSGYVISARLRKVFPPS